MVFRCALILLLLAAQSPLSAATFVVNDLFDDPDANPGDGVCDIPAGGPPRCSLRAAIMEANAASPTQTHVIEFSLGLIVINISGSPLPTVTNRVRIDGRTAPSYAGGDDVLSAPPSVYINGSGLTGTTADGLRFTSSLASSVHALGIINFPDNGIEIINTELLDVSGTWIGVSRSGGVDGNDGAGIRLSGCDRCRIGQYIAGGVNPIRNLGNVISNNGESGVYTQLGDDEVIGGNYIGFNPVGASSMGNGMHGIHLVSPNVQVGGFVGFGDGSTADIGNEIVDNAGDGILTATGGHRIYSNVIASNGGNGIDLNGANTNIGFTSQATRNQIIANGSHGIEIGSLLGSSGNLVQNQSLFQNIGRGIFVSDGDNNVLRGNAIADNLESIRIEGNDNQVVGNRLGLIGDVVQGGDFNGVVLLGDDNEVENNVIAGMGDDGIDVVSGNGNQLFLNFIGTFSDGTSIANQGNGIRVRAAAVLTLIEDNVIGYNNDGIKLEGDFTDVCGNRIGIASGDEFAGNRVEGVRVDGDNNRIGDGDFGCPGNVIGNNASDGVQVSGLQNVVSSNTIGGIPGIPAPNGNSGIFLAGTTTDSFVLKNLLFNNANDGIRVAADAGQGNRFIGNNFGNNGDQSVDLRDDGATANDAGDGDSGPNNLQNYPEIISVVDVGGAIDVTYRVDSSGGNADYPLTVDIYLNNSGKREGFPAASDTYDQAANTPKS
ncbi:MAG: right-handed parallel beta-helix repeat-containing protein, partial [Pseudomonadota bacterium]